MGDRVRLAMGGLSHIVNSPDSVGSNGSFYMGYSANPASRLAFGTPGGSGVAMYSFAHNPSRVVPVGAANVPRSWGALACAYFGQPCAG